MRRGSFANGLEELTVPGYDFWYGESISLNYATNTLYYYARSINRSYCINRVGYLSNSRIVFTNESLLEGETVYDKVVVVPFRALYEIYHALEGINALVRFYIKYGNNTPVCLVTG